MEVLSNIKKSLMVLAFMACLIWIAVPTLAFAKKTILIVGDSLSAGYGLKIGEGWATLLQVKLKENGYDYDVVNSSISGDTTSNGLARLPAALKQYQPKITLIELGGNDGLRGLALSTIKNNLQLMIQLAKKSGSKILLIGVRLPPNYGKAYTEKFQKIYVELAKENKIGLVPNLMQDVDDQENLMSSDGIHPQASAQAKLVENVWGNLSPMLQTKA